MECLAQDRISYDCIGEPCWLSFVQSFGLWVYCHEDQGKRKDFGLYVFGIFLVEINLPKIWLSGVRMFYYFAREQVTNSGLVG